jgi:hypothetical protein
LLPAVAGYDEESVTRTQYTFWKADGVLVTESWVLLPTESVLNGLPEQEPDEYHFTVYGGAPPLHDVDRIIELPSCMTGDDVFNFGAAKGA